MSESIRRPRRVAAQAGLATSAVFREGHTAAIQSRRINGPRLGQPSDSLFPTMERISHIGHRAADEAAVVAAAQSGHSGSFDLLVQRYERGILHLALRITRNLQDAEDVRQESFHKAFVHLGSFKGQSSFSTWLTRIAINEALILLRKNRARREVPNEKPIEGNGIKRALETFDPRHTPERDCLEQERKQILCFALSGLTPGTRMAIQMRELEERTTKETAEILRISPTTVKSRVFRGRRKLREVLSDYACLRGYPREQWDNSRLVSSD